jgi:hypothetical protein
MNIRSVRYTIDIKMVKEATWLRPMDGPVWAGEATRQANKPLRQQRPEKVPRSKTHNFRFVLTTATFAHFPYHTKYTQWAFHGDFAVQGFVYPRRHSKLGRVADHGDTGGPGPR